MRVIATPAPFYFDKTSLARVTGAQALSLIRLILSLRVHRTHRDKNAQDAVALVAMDARIANIALPTQLRLVGVGEAKGEHVPTELLEIHHVVPGRRRRGLHTARPARARTTTSTNLSPKLEPLV